MEEKGITNLYIDELMNKISSSYRGTFPCDTIPHFFDENVSLIINLSRHDEEGSHLISVYILKRKIIYFDPFGIKSNNTYINKYLLKYNKKIVYSKKTVQHILSSHCGFFVMSFILFVEKHKSLAKYLSLFNTKHLKCNDFICVEIIKYYIQSKNLKNNLSKLCKNIFKYNKSK